MEAPISGPQRKVFDARVKPVRSDDGTEGITVRNGATTPFSVYRAWVGPAGHYPEAWYLIDPSTREVLFEWSSEDLHILGLQALTKLETEVKGPIRLPAGKYQIVFALGGIKGGELDVQVAEAPSVAAA